jgi:hypothetical protein
VELASCEQYPLLSKGLSSDVDFTLVESCFSCSLSMLHGVTKLDCYTYRGARAARDVSSFMAVTPLGPGHSRHYNTSVGRFVFAGSAAAREGLGSQVAYRLAIDYFLSGVSSHLGQVRDPNVPSKEEPAVVLIPPCIHSGTNSPQVGEWLLR